MKKKIILKTMLCILGLTLMSGCDSKENGVFKIENGEDKKNISDIEIVEDENKADENLNKEEEIINKEEDVSKENETNKENNSNKVQTSNQNTSSKVSKISVKTIKVDNGNEIYFIRGIDKNENVVWEVNTGAHFVPNSDIVLIHYEGDKNVYYYSNGLVALDKQTGKKVWHNKEQVAKRLDLGSAYEIDDKLFIVNGIGGQKIDIFNISTGNYINTIDYDDIVNLLEKEENEFNKHDTLIYGYNFVKKDSSNLVLSLYTGDENSFGNIKINVKTLELSYIK